MLFTHSSAVTAERVGIGTKPTWKRTSGHFGALITGQMELSALDFKAATEVIGAELKDIGGGSCPDLSVEGFDLFEVGRW